MEKIYKFILGIFVSWENYYSYWFLTIHKNNNEIKNYKFNVFPLLVVHKLERRIEVYER